jgi:hypothetical protein
VNVVLLAAGAGCLAGAGTGGLERAAVEADPDFDLRSRSRSAAFSVGIFLPRHPLGNLGHPR